MPRLSYCHELIHIDDDEEAVDDIARQVADYVRERDATQGRDRRLSGAQISPVTIFDLEEEDKAEAGLERTIEAIDLTVETPRRHRIGITPLSGTTLQSVVLPGLNLALKPGMTVELKEPHGPFKAQFLKIKLILRNHKTGEIKVHGHQFARALHFKGQLGLKRNEVCLLCEYNEDDDRSSSDQSLLEIAITNICRKRDLLMTNASFPAHRFNREDYANNLQVADHGPLVCRWRHIISFSDTSRRITGREWAYERIFEEDADEEFRSPNKIITEKWRGGKACHWSAPKSTSSQKYTVGDMFSGGGGTSRGAEQAGFQIEVAVDNDYYACNTYKSNFAGTLVSIFPPKVSLSCGRYGPTDTWVLLFSSTTWASSNFVKKRLTGVMSTCCTSLLRASTGHPCTQYRE
jgi:DNA (cytosine-5)-methyltransferase 1